MLVSTATRSLLRSNGAVLRQNVRLMSSVASSEKQAAAAGHNTTAKREIHSDPPQMKSAPPLQYASQPTYLPEDAADEKEEEAATSGMADRFKITAEVTVSKIFPAGFGWQSSSIFAEEYLGYSADSMAFALTTGLGDAIGVMAGHCVYYAAKKSITGDDSINMERETQTGLLLASAAFCSGTAWQPLVDVLQGANLPFMQVFAGTWIGCGTAFYLGLRGARTILSGPCKYIHEPTYENSKTDKSLSAAIGGATGFFVGTDTAYLPAQNFLFDVVGIHDATPQLMGCAIAGTSTGLGFVAAQTTLNAIYPAGKLWNDGK
mmetsp:Transcript_12411/g.24811  ORF Transcript_12411/g.24811 Transcript_12411/m.24811 type:complete len:319 (+) Transcript_12411:81-1037(+)